MEQCFLFSFMFCWFGGPGPGPRPWIHQNQQITTRTLRHRLINLLFLGKSACSLVSNLGIFNSFLLGIIGTATSLAFWGQSMLATKMLLLTKRVQETQNVVEIQCTRLQMMLYVFFLFEWNHVFAKIWRPDDLNSFVTRPKRIIPGQFWMMDNLWKQFQSSLFWCMPASKWVPNPIPDVMNSCLFFIGFLYISYIYVYIYIFIVQPNWSGQ